VCLCELRPATVLALPVLNNGDAVAGLA